MVIDGYDGASGFCKGHWPSDPNQCGGVCNIGVYQDSACIPGYTLQPDGTCQKPKPNCPAVGQSAPGGNTANGTSPTQTILNPQVCVGGCAYTYGSYWTGATPGQSGGFPAQYTGLKSTGNACDGTGTPSAATPSPSDPPKQCGDKQYSGTVNGVLKCIDYPIQTNGGTTTNTTDPGPASGVPASGVQPNPGTGTTTTNTSTTCDGTTCTTTTVTVGTTTGSGGASSPTGNMPCPGAASGVAANGTCTTTTTQPQQQYCAEHPEDPQCKSKGSWGGDCSAGFSCDGDVVQCAIAKRVYQDSCDLNSSNAVRDLGAKVLAGNDPVADPMKKGGTRSIGSMLNTDDLLGGGALPPNPTFTALGQSFTLDLQPLYDQIPMIRAFILATASFICLAIIFL
ncbi:Uncharacterised protein [Chlamydia trachomatis]|nr:Uncharacterised protein [Chlamydia trachomatis]